MLRISLKVLLYTPSPLAGEGWGEGVNIDSLVILQIAQPFVKRGRAF